MNGIKEILSGADGRWDIESRQLSIGIGTAFAIGSSLLSFGGSNKAASGIKEQGRLARKKGREQQTYNEVAAQEVLSIGQMNASEDRRQARLIASRAVAVAAAGGAVEDIEHLLGDIHGEGAYRAAITLMDAQSQSDRLLFEGKQAAEYGASLYESAKGSASAQRASGYASLLKTGAALFGGFDFGE